MTLLTAAGLAGGLIAGLLIGMPLGQIVNAMIVTAAVPCLAGGVLGGAQAMGGESSAGRCRGSSSACGRAGRWLLLEPEADLHRDLILRDVAIGDTAAHVGHFEPVEIAQRVRRALDAA